MPIDCKYDGARVETGKLFACVSSRDGFSRASLGTGMLKRKVDSTIAIRVFFINYPPG
jgi:hypothetical protein